MIQQNKTVKNTLLVLILGVIFVTLFAFETINVNRFGINSAHAMGLSSPITASSGSDTQQIAGVEATYLESKVLSIDIDSIGVDSATSSVAGAEGREGNDDTVATFTVIPAGQVIRTPFTQIEQGSSSSNWQRVLRPLSLVSADSSSSSSSNWGVWQLRLNYGQSIASALEFSRNSELADIDAQGVIYVYDQNNKQLSSVAVSDLPTSATSQLGWVSYLVESEQVIIEYQGPVVPAVSGAGASSAASQLPFRLAALHHVTRSNQEAGCEGVVVATTEACEPGAKQSAVADIFLPVSEVGNAGYRCSSGVITNGSAERYFVTAAHCLGLSSADNVLVEGEVLADLQIVANQARCGTSGEDNQVRIRGGRLIAYDLNSDIALIGGLSQTAAEIAAVNQIATRVQIGVVGGSGSNKINLHTARGENIAISEEEITQLGACDIEEVGNCSAIRYSGSGEVPEAGSGVFNESENELVGAVVGQEGTASNCGSGTTGDETAHQLLVGSLSQLLFTNEKARSVLLGTDTEQAAATAATEDDIAQAKLSGDKLAFDTDPYKDLANVDVDNFENPVYIQIDDKVILLWERYARAAATGYINLDNIEQEIGSNALTLYNAPGIALVPEQYTVKYSKCAGVSGTDTECDSIDAATTQQIIKDHAIDEARTDLFHLANHVVRPGQGIANEVSSAQYYPPSEHISESTSNNFLDLVSVHIDLPRPTSGSGIEKYKIELLAKKSAEDVFVYPVPAADQVFFVFDEDSEGEETTFTDTSDLMMSVYDGIHEGVYSNSAVIPNAVFTAVFHRGGDSIFDYFDNIKDDTNQCTESTSNINMFACPNFTAEITGSGSNAVTLISVFATASGLVDYLGKKPDPDGSIDSDGNPVMVQKTIADINSTLLLVVEKHAPRQTTLSYVFEVEVEANEVDPNINFHYLHVANQDGNSVFINLTHDDIIDNYDGSQVAVGQNNYISSHNNSNNVRYQTILDLTDPPEDPEGGPYTLSPVIDNNRVDAKCVGDNICYSFADATPSIQNIAALSYLYDQTSDSYFIGSASDRRAMYHIDSYFYVLNSLAGHIASRSDKQSTQLQFANILAETSLPHLPFYDVTYRVGDGVIVTWPVHNYVKADSSRENIFAGDLIAELVKTDDSVLANKYTATVTTYADVNEEWYVLTVSAAADGTDYSDIAAIRIGDTEGNIVNLNGTISIEDSFDNSARPVLGKPSTLALVGNDFKTHVDLTWAHNYSSDKFDRQILYYWEEGENPRHLVLIDDNTSIRSTDPVIVDIGIGSRDYAVYIFSLALQVNRPGSQIWNSGNERYLDIPLDIEPVSISVGNIPLVLDIDSRSILEQQVAGQNVENNGAIWLSWPDADGERELKFDLAATIRGRAGDYADMRINGIAWEPDVGVYRATIVGLSLNDGEVVDVTITQKDNVYRSYKESITYSAPSEQAIRYSTNDNNTAAIITLAGIFAEMPDRYRISWYNSDSRKIRERVVNVVDGSPDRDEVTLRGGGVDSGRFIEFFAEKENAMTAGTFYEYGKRSSRIYFQPTDLSVYSANNHIIATWKHGTVPPFDKDEELIYEVIFSPVNSPTNATTITVTDADRVNLAHTNNDPVNDAYAVVGYVPYDGDVDITVSVQESSSGGKIPNLIYTHNHIRGRDRIESLTGEGDERTLALDGSTGKDMPHRYKVVSNSETTLVDTATAPAETNVSFPVADFEHPLTITPQFSVMITGTAYYVDGPEVITRRLNYPELVLENFTVRSLPDGDLWVGWTHAGGEALSFLVVVTAGGASDLYEVVANVAFDPSAAQYTTIIDSTLKTSKNDITISIRQLTPPVALEPYVAENESFIAAPTVSYTQTTAEENKVTVTLESLFATTAATTFARYSLAWPVEGSSPTSTVEIVGGSNSEVTLSNIPSYTTLTAYAQIKKVGDDSNYVTYAKRTVEVVWLDEEIITRSVDGDIWVSWLRPAGAGENVTFAVTAKADANVAESLEAISTVNSNISSTVTVVPGVTNRYTAILTANVSAARVVDVMLEVSGISIDGVAPTLPIVTVEHNFVVAREIAKPLDETAPELILDNIFGENPDRYLVTADSNPEDDPRVVNVIAEMPSIVNLVEEDLRGEITVEAQFKHAENDYLTYASITFIDDHFVVPTLQLENFTVRSLPNGDLWVGWTHADGDGLAFSVLATASNDLSKEVANVAFDPSAAQYTAIITSTLTVNRNDITISITQLSAPEELRPYVAENESFTLAPTVSYSQTTAGDNKVTVTLESLFATDVSPFDRYSLAWTVKAVEAVEVSVGSIVDIVSVDKKTLVIENIPLGVTITAYAQKHNVLDSDEYVDYATRDFVVVLLDEEISTRSVDGDIWVSWLRPAGAGENVTFAVIAKADAADPLREISTFKSDIDTTVAGVPGVTNRYTTILAANVSAARVVDVMLEVSDISIDGVAPTLPIVTVEHNFVEAREIAKPLDETAPTLILNNVFGEDPDRYLLSTESGNSYNVAADDTNWPNITIEPSHLNASITVYAQFKHAEDDYLTYASITFVADHFIVPTLQLNNFTVRSLPDGNLWVGWTHEDGDGLAFAVLATAGEVGEASHLSVETASEVRFNEAAAQYTATLASNLNAIRNDITISITQLTPTEELRPYVAEDVSFETAPTVRYTQNTAGENKVTVTLESLFATDVSPFDRYSLEWSFEGVSDPPGVTLQDVNESVTELVLDNILSGMTVTADLQKRSEVDSDEYVDYATRTVEVVWLDEEIITRSVDGDIWVSWLRPAGAGENVTFAVTAAADANVAESLEAISTVNSNISSTVTGVPGVTNRYTAILTANVSAARVVDVMLEVSGISIDGVAPTLPIVTVEHNFVMAREIAKPLDETAPELILENVFGEDPDRYLLSTESGNSYNVADDDDNWPNIAIQASELAENITVEAQFKHAEGNYLAYASTIFGVDHFVADVGGGGGSGSGSGGGGGGGGGCSIFQQLGFDGASISDDLLNSIFLLLLMSASVMKLSKRIDKQLYKSNCYFR